MVRPELQKWSLSLSTLTERSISDEHPRTHERLTALVLRARGQADDGYRGPARSAAQLHDVLEEARTLAAHPVFKKTPKDLLNPLH